MIPTLNQLAKEALDAIHKVHSAFGAPGDYGYGTKEGAALYALYQAGNNLQASINLESESAPKTGGAA